MILFTLLAVASIAVNALLNTPLHTPVASIASPTIPLFKLLAMSLPFATVKTLGARVIVEHSLVDASIGALAYFEVITSGKKLVRMLFFIFLLPPPEKKLKLGAGLFFSCA